MEDQEYVIKGTIEGMIKILHKDFNMSFDEAKFFVYIMIDQQSGEAVNAVDKEELDTWYLRAETDRHKGQILNTHLVINFSMMKKELVHAAYIFLVKFFFARGIDIVLIGADLVYTVAVSIKKVKDEDYCVYARIIELCIGNKNRFFNVEDIVTANKEGKCDYQEEDWRCTYLGNDDDCICTEEKITLAFERLAEQNIITNVGERWMLMR